MADRIKATYSGPILDRTDLPLSMEVLHKIGKALVETFAMESKKDFAKRGWSGEARDGTNPIWNSFSYRIRGERTVEVLSTFPGLDVLTKRDIPPYRMTWLTQEGKDKTPSDYQLTDREQKRGMKFTGRVSRGERLPLVVPLKSEGGAVVFRTAPLTMEDAWVHPGIARFTFAERAQRKAREKCVEILKEAAVQFLKEALS